MESSETLRHVLEEQHQSFPVVSSEGLLRGLVRRELLEKHVRERGGSKSMRVLGFEWEIGRFPTFRAIFLWFS